MVTYYSVKDFERPYLQEAIAGSHEAMFLKEALSGETAALSGGSSTVSIFAGDDASAGVLQLLSDQGVRQIATRAAGYDNIDLVKAAALGIRVANVPAYSPYAIAEHAVALMLALNRKLIRADRQVHTGDFTVGSLVGFDLHGKTAGIIGTGRIGSKTAAILHGFGCRLLGYDLYPDPQLAASCSLQYTDLATLCRESDIITIHTCLSDRTKHLIGEDAISGMKPGVMLINTARGSVVDTAAVIRALQTGQIGSYGADVYEKEKGVFFYDRTLNKPADPVLDGLLQMPNVLLTPHQAFATREALRNIADTTVLNITCWEKGRSSPNEL